MKKLTFFIIFLVIGSIAGGVFFFSQNNKFSVVSESPVENLKAEIIKEEINSSALEEEASVEKIEKSLPSTFKLEVPFVPQAPFAVWDDDHNEACEEAAILTVDVYLKKKAITPELADKEILAMINYQKENWQGHFDLTAEDIAKLAKEFYGYKNTEIKYDISIDDIKKEIVSGNPVILPTAGRMLFGPLEEGKNPYYRSPGPLYHMVVAIGFDDAKGVMIVNDPGTKNGKEFSFKYEVLENAIHDWNNGNVENGKKAMIILAP